MPNLGLVRLRTERCAHGSVVKEQYSQSPLQAHRPLYLERGAPPVVFLKTPSSGLLEGDEHRIDISVGEGSALTLATQASTLAYPGSSRQTLTAHIHCGGFLKFHPHMLILGAESALRQRTVIHLEPGASLDYQEEWCAGRIAMGECWRFSTFDYAIEILQSDKLVYRERWLLDTSKQDLINPVICGRFTHFKTRFLFGTAIEDSHSPSPACKSDYERQWTLKKESGRIMRSASRPVALSLRALDGNLV